MLVLSCDGKGVGARAAPGPVTNNKWLTASVACDAAQVLAQIFAEAERRDPDP